MDSKLVALMCMVSVAAASAPPHPFPQYSFGYDVQDALTGDYKGHQEQRTGELVTGSYSVVEPDGTRRVVDYAADPLNGFNAVVRREPLVAPALLAPAPAPYVAPAAPLIARAPIAPAPLIARAPLFAPAPAPLLAPRLPFYY